MTEHRPWTPNRLSTPRAAALAGVLFAMLFGTALVLLGSAVPEGGGPGSQGSAARRAGSESLRC